MQLSQRLAPLSFNVFADMDRAKALAKAAGQDLIDLSLGSSDLPAPSKALEAIAQSLSDSTTHGYSLFSNTQAFRQAAAQWYTDKFDIPVNPETEVLPLIGSQEGTAHLPLAILNPGDFALLQDPSYPSHSGGVFLAGGQVYPMPLLAENGFLPVLADIPPAVLSQAKMMVLSYPHNPTTAIAPLSFLQETVAFCQKHNLVLVHDAPYLDFVFDTFSQAPKKQSIAPSIFQADPEKTVSIEFFTMSKSYSMGGFRVGYAIGNTELIQALRQVKACIDFNQYQGILNGAIAALTGLQEVVRETVDIFRQRRDVFVGALHKIGWPVPIPSATMYVWAKLPEAWANNSVEFCVNLVKNTGVAVAPGAGFGKAGEGFVRFALVHKSEVLSRAVEKISVFLQK
ncbi:LL-diaminopimelate aminotransferase [Okeania hirsuta]|uniref:LL-diaminopimelate aminotransferase n=1 Tax=Okeania hirsuta TaxID=1458930 RepID=UPI000F54B1DC|nr:LL-diaminopimelate aminotransferase [Okeania hirsuta]RQH12948.1 LL-diaminopimelate aminotransferase [Okeania hirsuta]